MNRLLSFGLVLLSFGCTPEQPWSYAPCYLEQPDSESASVHDCPEFPSAYMTRMELAEKKQDGARFYALFTSLFWNERVPHIRKWRER